MLGFLAANWGTILIGMLIAAIAALILIKLRRDKKKGVSLCGGSCENCPSCGSCHSGKP